MSRLAAMNVQANDAGVSPLGEIRDMAIAQRNAALSDGKFQGAVYWTHLIWWLSVLTELLEADS